MRQQKILIDSCVYFRLARYISVGLLGTEFGDERYCLYLINGFEQEFLNNPGLQEKFPWVSDWQYTNNRESFSVTISNAQKKEVQFTTNVMQIRAKREGVSGFSKTDADALSTAKVLGIKLVTDDSGMLKMAKDLDIDAMKTLDLLKLMVDTGHIGEQDVHDIVRAWTDYIYDPPKDCPKDYRRIFGKKMP